MFCRFVFLLLLGLSVWPSVATAREDYVEPTWTNAIRTMVRFNAIDMTDMNLLDDYGAIAECELFKSFYGNDFKWNQVREAMIDYLKINAATFPAGYRFEKSMNLDRYDFRSKLFRFTKRTEIKDINAFRLVSAPHRTCNLTWIYYMPRVFRAVLAEPFFLDGIPLSNDEAKALVARMDRAGNELRTVYARFNVRIVYIEPYIRVRDYSRRMMYEQGKGTGRDEIRFDAHLDSIAFYDDPEMKRLIIEYHP